MGLEAGRGAKSGTQYPHRILVAALSERRLSNRRQGGWKGALQYTPVTLLTQGGPQLGPRRFHVLRGLIT